MRVVYRISEEEFMGAIDLIVAHQRWSRRWSWRVLPWLGGILAVVAMRKLMPPDPDPVTFVLLFLIGAYFVYAGLERRHGFREMYRKNQRFRREITAEAGEEGLHLITEDSESRLRWPSFIQFLESEKLFLLLLAEWNFVALPKRAFAPGEIEDFRGLARRNIPARRDAAAEKDSAPRAG